MAAGLFYPKYTPSESWLRSALLFFDSVHTIVPRADQENVLRRRHVDKLLQRDDRLVQLEDPSDDIKKKAFSDIQIYDLEHVISEVKRRKADPPTVQRKTHLSYVAESDLNYYLARQKITDKLYRILHKEGMAIKVEPYFRDGQLVEVDPILIHPRVADFIMARLADTVAQTRRLASLTNQPSDFSFNAFRDLRRPGTAAVEADLYSAGLHLLVPASIEKIPVDKYMEIRERYEGARYIANDLFQKIAQEEKLESVDDTREYESTISTIVERIDKEVRRQQERLKSESWRQIGYLSLVSIVAAVGAAVGASIGGPAGAAFGAIVPGGMERLGSVNVSVGGIPSPHRENYRALATLRQEVASAARLRRVVYPGVSPG